MLDDDDKRFFAQHPDRQAHIREPKMVLEVDKQRATRYVPECDWEFTTLGPHKKGRRRIMLWRVPATNPYYDPDKRPLLKIPFLAFSDETIEDRDDILLPILHEIMESKKGD